MTMHCNELVKETPVVFKKEDEYFAGTVESVDALNKTVCVSTFGNNTHTSENIEFANMIAVYNANGEIMKFGNIIGKSVLLEA